ncbi:hypothetical protein [Devosia sp. XK-2]|uniref:hypothetical protein n=1 Tax=Devosia sp. XK-2 TaxID=3126689 RepID=UPI0030D35522
MKLKSLILGSVAAAGLSTAGFAADLGVLTSLDVCDSLGISGLTISSADNCLQITGGVKYEFNWGDYRGAYVYAGILGGASNRDTMDNDGVSPSELDWESQMEAWLKFVGTASSDFGPASVTLKLKEIQETRVQNETLMATDDAKALTFDEAYVSVGDTTTLMAGKKGSIANFGDDEPFNWLGLAGSDWADKGVKWDILNGNLDTGGHVIQVVSAVADGVTIKAGLENLDDTLPAWAGTAVGVLEYAGEGITAHITGLAGGILDGNVEAWSVHAGMTGTFDAFKIRGAFAAQTVGATTAWHALLSGQGTFDMFTIALSGEALGQTGLNTDWGFGGSIGATVTEGVSINLGAKYFDSNNAGGRDGYQVAAQLVAAVSESIKLTGEVGVYGDITNSTSDFYGAAELAWAPGGGFTSSIKGEAHQNGAYKVTFKAAKEFK